MLHYFSALCAILCLSTSLFAQNCGTQEIFDRTLKEKPHLKEFLLNQEKQRVLKQHKVSPKQSLTGTIYTVPVVVHLVHDNGPENLTDVQVQNAIQKVNQMFRYIAPWNGAGGADSEIEFCLAKQDPAGNFTTGVNRVVDAARTNHTYYSSSTDLDLKNLIRWDPTKYINIWVVRNISGPVAGYALFPASVVHGNAADGIVIEYGALSSVALAHEIGHYLNLYHTFDGGCPNNDCELDGDHVCDTPPVGNSSGCARNSCSTDEDDAASHNPFRSTGLGGLGEQNDMANNYMDYSPWGCVNAFSPGQISRMRYTLANYRSSLLTSYGCVDPCPAVIHFNISYSSPITAGASHTFTNTSSNGTSWSWYINNVLVSTSQHLNFTFSNGGVYTIGLIASNANVSCTKDTSFAVNVVCPALTAGFTADVNPALAGQTIHFSNTTVTALDTTGKNFWYIDNVLQSTTKDFAAAITTPGQHSVKLIVGNNSSACTSEFILPVQIDCGAQADFIPSATSVAMGNSISFNNTSTGASSYKWLVNLSPVSTSTNYSQSFGTEGDFMITLVADNGICKDTMHQVISVFNPSACRSNRQNDNWYFGNTAAVNFSSGAPGALLTSNMNAPEGVATISNGSGNLLFYTNGVTVWDRTHVIMSNGSGLTGSLNSTQAALIVQQPGVDSLYYIFTNTANNAAGSLYYSVVNMNANGGLGAVVSGQKNILLSSNVTEKIAATYHGNGCDLWILTHKLSSNEYVAFLLSSSGIAVPVSSYTGLNHTATKGQLKFSPDGSMVSAAHYFQNMEVLSFNTFSGMLSNPISLNTGKYFQAYGTEFSPDGTNVYYTCKGMGQGSQGTMSAMVVQYDLTAGSAAAIASSGTTVGTFVPDQVSYEGALGSLQLGKDGKIYTVYYDRFYPSAFLHRISAPNIAGVGCNFQQNAIPLSGRTTGLGLPAILTSSLNTTDFSISCSGSNALEVAFSIIGAGSGIDSYYWDFGDGASGSSNFSNLPSPTHVFSSSGTYSITLVVKKYCQCATITKSVTVPVSCTLPAEYLSFNVIGKSNSDLVLWSVDESARQNTFRIQRSTDLTKVSTIAELTGKKLHYEYDVPVSAQNASQNRYYRIIQIDDHDVEIYSDWKLVEGLATQFVVYPNPANEKVKIVSLHSEATRLQLFNPIGELIKAEEFESEKNLDITHLSPGVYMLTLTTAHGQEQNRLVICR